MPKFIKIGLVNKRLKPYDIFIKTFQFNRDCTPHAAVFTITPTIAPTRGAIG